MTQHILLVAARDSDDMFMGTVVWYKYMDAQDTMALAIANKPCTGKKGWA